jgi:hypothetical protein
MKIPPRKEGKYYSYFSRVGGILYSDVNITILPILE